MINSFFDKDSSSGNGSSLKVPTPVSFSLKKNTVWTCDLKSPDIIMLRFIVHRTFGTSDMQPYPFMLNITLASTLFLLIAHTTAQDIANVRIKRAMVFIELYGVTMSLRRHITIGLWIR